MGQELELTKISIFTLVKHELYLCEEFNLFNSLSKQTKELQFVNWVVVIEFLPSDRSKPFFLLRLI